MLRRIKRRVFTNDLGVPVRPDRCPTIQHMTTATDEAPSLIEYPQPFPIKVMGLYCPELLPAIVAIARRFDPQFDENTIEQRPSRTGKYLGLTITIMATSRSQLDDIYRALTSHSLVKVVL